MEPSTKNQKLSNPPPPPGSLIDVSDLGMMEFLNIKDKTRFKTSSPSVRPQTQTCEPTTDTYITSKDLDSEENYGCTAFFSELKLGENVQDGKSRYCKDRNKKTL